jgi:hypothetical protein
MNGAAFGFCKLLAKLICSPVWIGQKSIEGSRKQSLAGHIKMQAMI